MTRQSETAPGGHRRGSSTAGELHTEEGTTLPLFVDGPSHWTDDLRQDLSPGQERAAAGVPTWWWRNAMRWVEMYAATGLPFGSDDIYEHAGDAPSKTQKVYGALFAAASRAGLIVPVGDTVSRTGNRVYLWVGAESSGGVAA